jgi:hypothetical protein
MRRSATIWCRRGKIAVITRSTELWTAEGPPVGALEMTPPLPTLRRLARVGGDA